MSATTETTEPVIRRQPRGQNLKRMLVMLPPELHERLTKDAARERRSNSAECCIALERYYEALDANA